MKEMMGKANPEGRHKTAETGLIRILTDKVQSRVFMLRSVSASIVSEHECFPSGSFIEIVP
jgi:hypothetical protein